MAILTYVSVLALLEYARLCGITFVPSAAQLITSGGSLDRWFVAGKLLVLLRAAQCLREHAFNFG